MAETLTFDNTTEQTSADSLTTEEQDSLQVGEQIQQQEDQLLAGKYENAQQLEKAYIELQKKMGSGDDEKGEQAEASTEEKTEEVPESPIEITPAVEAMTLAATEFENSGELTPETLAKFNDISTTDLVDTYKDLYAKAKELGYKEPTATSEPVELSDAQVDSIHKSVGGESNYNRVLNWASDNLDQNTLNSFDQMVQTGDSNQIQLAINGIKAQYDNANGYEGRMLTGKAPQTSSDVYRSQAEVVKAMSHPDYDTDPAYRQDVIDKLSRSDVSF
tara:strand:- start:403 stop:1227 length:825 start_codon:yes stop_codon:yes gene_type:complete